MNIVLYVLLALVIIVAILLILAIFVKKDYIAEREIIINRPKQDVFDYIKYLKNQNEWSKMGTATDPNMKIACFGTDGTVGFEYKWESDNKRIGKGRQRITKIIDGERIEWEYLFAKYPSTQCYWTTETVSENATKMKWGFTSRMNYPMNLTTLFLEKLAGKDLSEELMNLKSKMECSLAPITNRRERECAPACHADNEKITYICFIDGFSGIKYLLNNHSSNVHLVAKYFKKELRKIAMRIGLEDLHFILPRLHNNINSIDIIFRSSGNEEMLVNMLKKEIDSTFLQSVSIVIKSKQDFISIVTKSPFSGEEIRESKTFLCLLYNGNLADEIKYNHNNNYKLKVSNSTIYIQMFQDFHGSFFEKKINERKSDFVIRAWKRVEVLYDKFFELQGVGL